MRSVLKNPPKKAGDILGKLLRNLGVDSFAKEHKVFAVWDEAVGEPLCKNARPVAVHYGSLIVAVRDSAWIQELQFMKGDLKKRLNKHLGKGVITDIRFKLGSWEEEPEKAGISGDPQDETPPPEPDEETKAQAQEAVADIHDPRLRERMYYMLLSLARREKGDEE